jgi:3',5'-cyclic AMP phosphodiesterase CpdA
VILAQISDPHVHVGPDDQGSAEALAAALGAVAALDPAPDALLLSGDVTAHGSDPEYRRVADLLAPLDLPVHVLAGNHDDRAGMRTHLGAPGEGDAPIQYAVAVGGLRLVACDTTVPGVDPGEFGADRLAWLEACLAEDGDTPAIVAMHHPPILTGMPAMDARGLPEADRAAIAELLAGTRQVKRVVSGHVHRALTGESGGRPVFVCPSSHVQLALDLDSDEIALVREPPCFALHVATGCEVVSHLQPVGDYGPSFS